MDNLNILEVTAPIWGAFLKDSKPELTLKETKFNKLGSGISIFYPSIEELIIIKKSAISNTNTVIPLHIKILLPDLMNEGFTEKLINDSISIIKDVVYALRLYKFGWFMNPLFTEIVFENGMLINRLPGHYRQSFYYNAENNPAIHYSYELSKEDFSDNSSLLKIYRLLVEYKGHSNTSVDIAIDSFNSAFGYQIKLKDQLNFLFTSLDAAMGGMSASYIDNIKLKARFKERLQTLIDCAGLAITNEQLNWFDDYKNGGRAIRNGIAHGNWGIDLENIAEQNFENIYEVIKNVLIEYINFCTVYSINPALISDNFDITKANSYCGIFNKVLEECMNDSHKSQIFNSISFNNRDI
ncbi:hypothetical protein [Marinigracilibium pacificum]|uniref:Apea-like HEPN domain-containing protein n=1 Tax=Marinigracilibium pacificum TaxID=2729599 RepID=A0A848J6G7_9BACT|nr:hypothetical protein [Marinigracilibium pacificum]NMM50838.1 hypothetical protein [Marinigracilibium pacificum]